MAKEAQKLEITVLPQVNLLPPEEFVKRSRRLSVKISGAVASIGILAVVAAGVFTEIQVSNAQSALDTETQRGLALQREKAKYAEVPVVLEQINRAVLADALAKSADINWKAYSDALVATLPDGITLESVTVYHTNVIEDATESKDSIVLENPDRVGNITLVGRSAGFPNTEEWLASFAQIPGLVEPRLVVNELSSPSPGQESYEVTLTVEITSDAYTNHSQVNGETQQ